MINPVDCAITSAPLDAAALRQQLPEHAGCGGYVCFEGHVRDINHDRKVLRLEYESYDALAEKELERICAEAIETFGVDWIRAHHRKGSLGIGEPAVVIQVLARHRTEAFDACQYVINELKTRVPVWKKEFYADGTTNWTRCSHGHGQLVF